MVAPATLAVKKPVQNKVAGEPADLVGLGGVIVTDVINELGTE